MLWHVNDANAFCLDCQRLTVGVKPLSTGHDITRGNNGKTIREGSLCQLTPNFPLLGIKNPL